MTAALLAASLAAAAPAPKANYGVLVLAYGAGRIWRRDLGALRNQWKGVTIESVEGAADSLAIQRAIDRLARLRVAKIVAIPLETVSESPLMDQTRYLFGIREEPTLDLPDLSGKPPRELHAPLRPTLKRTSPEDRRRPKRLRSPVPLVLTATIDKSPVLVDILVDRAKAQSRSPSRDCLVLAAIAPRSDQALKTWRPAVRAIADQIGAKAGFRKAVAVGLRDGVRSSQKDKDLSELRATFRGLTKEGRVVVVPLDPNSDRLGQLLRRDLPGVAYRWNGQGTLGDQRTFAWIKSTAEAASTLPDVRQYRDDAPKTTALGGKQ